MRRILYIFSFVILACSIVLTIFSPDILSMSFAGAMVLIIILGIIFGIMPMLSMNRGLASGTEKIQTAMGIQTDSVWSNIMQLIPLFNHRYLDSLFSFYRERIEHQRKTGQILGDLDDYVNMETMSIKAWGQVVMQIPGTLTGLGILGTFVGLIIGIRNIGFSSVEAALTSVQELLGGINTAFYTSVAGVILSILFNILQKMTWNATIRQLSIFMDTFHKDVIPTVEEQQRYHTQRQMQMILERLDRIPKVPGFSISSYQDETSLNIARRNEKILMPQIIDGLKNDEFRFVLQPKYDINTKRLVAAEALVRWEHPKLGVVAPSVFLPMIEDNGFIIKLDKHTWDSVFAAVKTWTESGLNPVPIAINISKTDIVAGSVIETLTGLIKKHDVPPRLIEVEISRNAFIESPGLTNGLAKTLRQHGFKVILDGFDGDFVSLHVAKGLEVDEMKLDLRAFNDREEKTALPEIFGMAKQMNAHVSVEGIESMEEVSLLRKSGCTTGQGYYFSHPITQEKFLETIYRKPSK